MAYCQAHTVALTTNSSGAATGYTPVVNGAILAVKYVKTDFADGVDFTVTTEDTAQNVWVESDVNAAKTVAPRQPTHDTIGGASLYAALGEAVEDYVWACGERVKIVVASGGDTKTGSFILMVGG